MLVSCIYMLSLHEKQPAHLSVFCGLGPINKVSSALSVFQGSLVMDMGGDCPSELFDFLQTTHSCDLPETPCRKLSFSEGDPTPPFVKTSPPTVSTKASGSQQSSPDSSQTAPTDGPPKAKLLEAPVPGKKFGFGNAFKPSNLQFRSKSTDSNLGDQTTPTKSDIDLMKSEIEKAKEVVKQEKKTGKAAGDAANSKAG